MWNKGCCIFFGSSATGPRSFCARLVSRIPQVEACLPPTHPAVILAFCSPVFQGGDGLECLPRACWLLRSIFVIHSVLVLFGIHPTASWDFLGVRARVGLPFASTRNISSTPPGESPQLLPALGWMPTGGFIWFFANAGNFEPCWLAAPGPKHSSAFFSLRSRLQGVVTLFWSSFCL